MGFSGLVGVHSEALIIRAAPDAMAEEHRIKRSQSARLAWYDSNYQSQGKNASLIVAGAHCGPPAGSRLPAAPGREGR